VAIVQISRITNRKGYTENLPQLDGAEFGWCTDSRRLFIGNGTLQDGAPVIGNTEILTEFSDITVLSDYTYQDIVVGYAAQTGPTPADPVVRSVQAKLDDFASVRDFGATGDGVTDDTDAINRALYQLYCRENNSQIRRSLFFPAGTYLISDTIIVPTYAKLYGEGANHSIIMMSSGSTPDYVARYGDSRQQTGVNIGTNGAAPPQNIEISSMSFMALEPIDIFLIDRATQCSFNDVGFAGPITQSQIEDAGVVTLPDISALNFDSNSTLVTNNITFDECSFQNITYAARTTALTKSITISNSKFNLLYQGVWLTGGSPTGFRVVHNGFDNIYGEGVFFDNSNLNVSAYNAYYGVGNGLGAGAITPVVKFGNDNNISVGDMFERTDASDFSVPRVEILASTSASGGTQLQLGRYARNNGTTFDLLNNVSNQTIVAVNTNNTSAFKMDYTITRNTSVRTGSLVATFGGAYSDEYTQNTTTGITLTVTYTSGQLTVKYSSSNIGAAGTLTYSISHLA
jgi:hypothetical protein